jgi:hypothetical protein
MDASRFFHLDIRQDGANTGTRTDHGHENQISWHQRTAEYERTENGECDMVPCDHGVVLPKIFPGIPDRIPRIHSFVCVHVSKV